MNRQDTGKLGETLARRFLEQKGYLIIETNYRCPGGEIDIVAREGDYLVFVEVRTKKSNSFGSPEESITPVKMQRLIMAAASYQQDHDHLPELCRIDFVAVVLERGGKPVRIELLRNAVEG